ncbi:MAG: mechanosensitive ion channel family protein [Candidatus Binatia bacterium]
MDVNSILQTASTLVVTVGLKVVGAVVVFIVGRRLIDLSLRLVTNALTRQHIDLTVQQYVATAVSVALNLTLVVAILGYFGVETTSFAALLASAGVAIGVAWSGLLSNFAAGAFLVVLRPFKVGDFVTVASITGTVREIGLFATTLDTPDNVRTVVGNGKIFSDTIQNFSANPYRRVDLQFQLHHGVDGAAMARNVKERVTTIANVLADPAPDVEPFGATLAGPLFVVRPYCHTDHYWQVYFDTIRTVGQVFGELGYPPPQQHMVLQQRA